MPHRRRSRLRAETPRAWVRAGRVLLVINAVVLVVSCFTEHLWTWDGFLRGGQDFELSLLALLAFFCLILVLAQYFRRRTSELFDRSDAPSFAPVLSALPLIPAPPVPFFSSERPPGHRSSICLRSVLLQI